jgi:hypothetical protein
MRCFACGDDSFSECTVQFAGKILFLIEKSDDNVTLRTAQIQDADRNAPRL